MSRVPVGRRRFTVDEYHRLAECGVLGEDDRVELIGGEIVRMAAMGARHAACVTGLTELLVPRLAGVAVVRVQLPVAIPEHDEPEPDIALARPRPDRYAAAHPQPRDILLVIEVADTSLSYDREVKLPVYARAGVPESWLFDLAGRGIERHTEPVPEGYRRVARAGRGERLASTVLPDLRFDADELLGPPARGA
jgi:Uma2 family endonuclease